MSLFSLKVGAATAIAALFVGLFVFNTRPLNKISWTQEFALTFELNGVVETWHATQSIIWRRNNRLGGVNGPKWLSRIQGALPFKEFADGSVLVALLRTKTDAEYARKLAYRLHRDNLDESNRLEYISQLRAPLVIPRENFPLFAHLKNPRDPTDFQILEYGELGTAIPGLVLTGVTLTISPHETVDLSGLFEALPYLRDPEFDLKVLDVNPGDNSWLPPLYVYADDKGNPV